MSEGARRANTVIAVLFAVGSICFLVGPFPGYVQLVGSNVDGMTFFVGSIFFTAAALVQFLTTRLTGGHAPDWWASGIQLAGTLFFNISTFDAMQDALDTRATDRLVWAPDVFGSICFLVSSALAYRLVNGSFLGGRRRDGPERIALVNLLGSIAFGVSAVAAFVVPSTGNVLSLGAANFTTAVGATCFLIGSVLMMPAVSSRRRS